MKQEAEYPGWKVIVSFSFCPAIGGVVYAIFFLISNVSYDGTEIYFQSSFQDKNINALAMIAGVIWGFSAGAQYLYFIPAIILACCYSRFRLYKSLKSVLLVTLVGGLGASAFTILYSQSYGTSFFSWEKFSFPFSFILGSVSSFLVGLLALPERPGVAQKMDNAAVLR